MKIVITDAGTVDANDLDMSAFDKFGEVVKYDFTPADLTRERIADADIVICNKTVLGEKELEGSGVKLITLFATGYNNIDVKYAAAKGITVCNAGQYSTKAVAQQVFAYILDRASRVSEYSSFVADGGWVRSKFFTNFSMPTHEILGQTLGIVGFGSIGKEVARIAQVFGMRVIVYTRTVREFPGVEFASLDRLLGESDFITVHVPLTPETSLMFGRDAFAKCKKSAYFINTSRGGTVDEQALRDALDNGIIAGAAVDVVTYEPMRADCPLLNAKNITVTPHIAWAPLETRIRLMGIVENNIKCWLDGSPVNKVN